MIGSMLLKQLLGLHIHDLADLPNSLFSHLLQEVCVLEDLPSGKDMTVTYDRGRIEIFAVIYNIGGL